MCANLKQNYWTTVLNKCRIFYMWNLVRKFCENGHKYVSSRRWENFFPYSLFYHLSLSAPSHCFAWSFYVRMFECVCMYVWDSRIKEIMKVHLIIKYYQIFNHLYLQSPVINYDDGDVKCVFIFALKLCRIADASFNNVDDFSTPTKRQWNIE